MKYKIFVILFGILAVIGYFYVRQQLLKQKDIVTYQTDKLLDNVDGEVVEISTSAKSIIIKNDLKKDIVISLKNDTRILDKVSGTTKLADIKKGFSLIAYGRGKENEIFNAREIRITKTPAVIVYEPKSQSEIGKIFKIIGIARVFENVVSLRLTNKRSGEVLIQDTAYANAPDIGFFGDYTYTADLTKKENLIDKDELLLEVYQGSAKDGSEIDKVTIPLFYSQ